MITPDETAIQIGIIRLALRRVLPLPPLALLAEEEALGAVAGAGRAMESDEEEEEEREEKDWKSEDA